MFKLIPAAVVLYYCCKKSEKSSEPGEIVQFSNNFQDSGASSADSIPNTFIIGAKGCGAEKVNQYLSHHRNVASMRDLVDFGILGNSSVENVDEIRDFYHKQFSHRNERYTQFITLEYGKGYLVKKNLAKKISEINKNASIILTVCDPVARLWSDWLSLQEQVENNLSLNGTGDLDRDSDYNDSDYRVVLLKF